MISGARLAKTHGGWRPPWVTLMLAALVAGLYAALGPAPEPLLFEPARPAEAAPWRALTGHLVHSDLRHLAWNLAALLGLGTLYEAIAQPQPMRYLGLLLAAALAIDLWLWALAPELARYCGLSGVLNALLAALVWDCWRRSRHPIFLLIGLAAAAKILIEAALGGALLPTSEWQAVPGAHAAGFLAGALWALAAESAFPRDWYNSQAIGRRRLRLVCESWRR